MKTFIFTINNSKHQFNGGRRQVADIYRMKRNVPTFLSSVKWSAASYRGAVSEVMNKLCDIGELPRKNRGYYSSSNGKFTIHQL